jgi:hypothetical protein
MSGGDLIIAAIYETLGKLRAKRTGRAGVWRLQ